jgi:TadE-like protein
MREPARTRGESGAVLVESAIVLPVFLLIVFGIIEFGLAFTASATTVSSTREGARYGSANFAIAADRNVAADQIRDLVEDDLDALTGLDTPVTLWIYRANANGYPGALSSFSACVVNCYQYTWTGGHFVRTTGNTDPSRWSAPDACGTTLDSIGVYLEVRHRYMTGYLTRIIGQDNLLKESTVSRLEPLPLTQCPAGG